MEDNEYIASTIVNLLEKGSPLVMASILSLVGSSPRHTGTRMVIGEDGRGYGTIGGSLIEATAIKESRKVIIAKKSKIVDFELSGKDATAAGMICGGQAQLLLDYFEATPENRALFQSWQEAIRSGKEFRYITYLKDQGEEIQVTGHSILYADDTMTNIGQVDLPGMQSLKAEIWNLTSVATLTSQDTRIIVNPIRKLKSLYLFGAGHVALPTAHIAALVGFRVVVVDDRPEFANAERFPSASQIYVIDDFNHALEGLEIDPDSYIVIITRGHQYDRSVLEQSLRTSAGYIGMISSRRKRDAIYTALIERGFKPERLEEVHSPIGIDISGETPEEIAVSIVAELIQERSRLQP
jgi:xanthine dehydrogenase accessory factor